MTYVRLKRPILGALRQFLEQALDLRDVVLFRLHAASSFGQIRHGLRQRRLTGGHTGVDIDPFHSATISLYGQRPHLSRQIAKLRKCL